MERKLFFLGLALLISSALSFVSPPPFVSADAGIHLSPVIYEVFLNPGEAKTIPDFEFLNPIDDPQEINISLKDIRIRDETGGVQLLDESHGRYSLSRWMTVEPVEFTLGSQEHKPVSLTIKVPDNAEPGGHYGALFGETGGPSSDVKETGMAATAGVAAPILLTVAGPVSYTGEIIEFREIPFVNLGPVDFLIRFKNTGTVHYKPHGIIEVFNWFGNKVDVVSVSEQRAFPETIRQLPATWNRRLLFGQYRAVATIYFGAEDERQDTAEISFWAFPYKPLAVLIGVSLVLWVLKKVKKKLEF